MVMVGTERWKQQSYHFNQIDVYSNGVSFYSAIFRQLCFNQHKGFSLRAFCSSGFYGRFFTPLALCLQLLCRQLHEWAGCKDCSVSEWSRRVNSSEAQTSSAVKGLRDSLSQDGYERKMSCWEAFETKIFEGFLLLLFLTAKFSTTQIIKHSLCD